MDYEGDVQGILQRKESNFWQTYHFLLVKDRLLVFDIDKKGNRCGQIKEIVDLNQYCGLTDPNEIQIQAKAQTVKEKGGSLRHKMSSSVSLTNTSTLNYLGIDFPPEYTLILKAVNENQSGLTIRSSSKEDAEMWRAALSLVFSQKPKPVDRSAKLKKCVAVTVRRLKKFVDLAENYKLPSSPLPADPSTPLTMLQTLHEVIVGVRDTIDNAEQLRATLPRGITSLSELDKCQTELHQALSSLVLWTNRHVMLNVTSETEPAALVSPVTQLVQKMMSICLQNYHTDARGLQLHHDLDDLNSQSSGHGSLPFTDNFSTMFQSQGNIRYSSYSSQSSESYNDSLPLGWSPHNQRHSILSSDSIPEGDYNPDLPPPHPSLLAEQHVSPPLPPPAPAMLRLRNAASLEKRHALPPPPPLPPRTKGPSLPPRYGSQSSNISGEFNNLALFESHVYCTSGHFAQHIGNGESRGSSMSSSLERHYSHEYHVPGGGIAPVPPPVPSRQISYSRDTGIWVDGSGSSHRSSSSHYTDESDSETESESDTDSGLEEEDMDEPPPLPPKNRLTFSQLYSMRLPPSVPPPPLPPRAYNFEMKGTPANGTFPAGPPPTLPSRASGGPYFNGAKNYTRMMDRYAPSFEIDEEYLKMSLQEPAYHDFKESVYHTYHREEPRTHTPPRTKSPPRTHTPPRTQTPPLAQSPPHTQSPPRTQIPPRPVTPPRPTRTVAQTTDQSTESTEVDAKERMGILFEVDPGPELLYNYGPAKKGDSMHSNIKGGTVDALIAEATIYRDTEFVQTIIFTHSTFTTTDEILKKCMKRYQYFSQTNKKLAENCVKLFNDILSNIWMGLTKSMIDIASDFIQLLFDELQMPLALSLQNTLLTQFQYCKEHKCDVVYSPATSISSEHLNWTFLLKVKPRDIALQMTQIDFEKFSKIKLCEILKYVKVPAETTSPNMCSFVNHFNSVSFWASSLVLRRDSKDERQRVYRRLLSVMEHLIKLNNFSSAFALFAALCKTAVRRVVNLSSKQEKILDASQSLMDSSESYKNLRSALKSATPPLIAYLGLCMADLTFLIHGNPDLLESGDVNFTKRHLTYTFMNVVGTSQAVPYNIAPRDDIITFFNNFSDYLQEEEMWQRSEQIKPRKKRS